MLQGAYVDSPLSHLPSQSTDGESSLSGRASEYEAESGRAVWSSYSVPREVQLNSFTDTIPIMHSVSKAKFGAADIYSGGAGYHSISRMQQHENGGGSIIDASVVSSYSPASSVGMCHQKWFIQVMNLSWMDLWLFICYQWLGNHQGLQATSPNTGFYSHYQDNSPVIHNESTHGITFNGPSTQFDLSSWNEMTKMNKGIHQLPPYQSHVPSEQRPFTEGPGIESFSFDEVYSNGLDIKDDGHADTDREALWQVTGAFLCGNIIYIAY